MTQTQEGNQAANLDARLKSSRALLILRIVSVLLLMTLMLRIAWIGDDSLITLRAILNLTHGWGPGFNAFESVQSSTHPLWFLVWMGTGALTGNWIVSILVLSVLLAASAVFLILQRVTSVAGIIIVTGSLALSNAFMEYTSSGLENSLAYLCLAALLLFTTKNSLTPTSHQILFGLTVAALILTRLDLVLLVLPVLVLIGLTIIKSWRSAATVLASVALPLLAWFLWSWFTYATLLPNTLTAKQNASIPRSEFLIQGFRYLWVSFERDPITLVVLLAGMCAALVVRSRILQAWMSGVILYIAYVMWIGGDFMVGRFFAVPVFVSAAVLGIAVSSRPTAHPGRQAAESGLVIAAAALILGGMGLPPTSLSPPSQPRWEFAGTAGIADEYGYHLAFSRDLRHAMMRLGSSSSVPPFQNADSIDPAVTIRELDAAASLWPSAPTSGTKLPSAVVPQYGFLGTVGILTGPTVHLVDQYALTDRFLAEQPYDAEPFQWRIGHFDRPLPAGYLEAVETGDPSRLDDPFLQGELRTLWSVIR